MRETFNNHQTNYIFFDNNPEHRTFAIDVFKKSKGLANILFVGSSQSFDNTQWNDFERCVNARTIKFDSEILSFTDKQIKQFFSGGRSEFFFISKNADRNASLSSQIMRAAKKCGATFDDFSMYVAPNWEEIERFLITCQNDILAAFDVKLVNPSKLAAYTLSKKFRPVDAMVFDPETLRAKKDIKVAVVGFTRDSREALLKTYEQGRFEGAKFIADVFDVSVRAKCRPFTEKFSGLMRDAEFSEIESNPSDLARKADFGKYDLVIADLGDESATADFTRRVQERLIESFNAETTLAPFLETTLWDTESMPNVQPFGSLESVYSVDAIIADAFTSGGRFVNDYYNKTKLDSMKMKNWIGMTDFERGSNISVADFNYSFVKMIGRETFGKFADGNEYRSWLRANPVKYDTLARTEHLRWCAYLYSRGWDKLRLSSEIMVENKNIAKKLHTCLVPFDELRPVSEMFGEDYEKYDRDNVDIVFELNKILSARQSV